MNRTIEELITEMTIEEKVSLIHGNGLFRNGMVKRLGIPSLKMSDGPMGVRNEFADNAWILVGTTEDAASYLPCESAVAATWNTDMAYQIGKVLGNEARGRGKDVILAPGVNIIRSPLGGRNFEYLSEDPFLVEKMAIPYINGIQENDVAACVKHFAVNNQETNRMHVEVLVDERTLNEIYFPAFKAAVQKANVHTLMGAYNKFRGNFCCESKELLDVILRQEWGFDGVVISDWGAVHNTKEATECSLDLEMSVTNEFDEYCLANPLLEMVKKGEVSEDFIDEKVRRILKLIEKLKIGCEDRKAGTYNTPQHREVIYQAAAESVVLLKNADNKLPIHINKIKSIGIIGQNAEKIHSNGGGSSEIKALYEISPLMGMKTKIGGNIEVRYAKGYFYEEPKKEEHNWQETSLEDVINKARVFTKEDEEAKKMRKKYLDEAVQLASEVDEVVIFGGYNHDYDSEGLDRENMTLPYQQDELIKEVLKVKPDAVVVMIGGSPIDMSAWVEDAKSIVWGWYGGMETGNALADVILGNVNPSGKLPVTFPKVASDAPTHYFDCFPGGETVEYKEGIFVGYRYYDTYQVEPQFCFGHGLSYTTFVCSMEEVTVKEEDELKILVSVKVKNTGNIAGAETIQLYVSSKDSKVQRASRELKGFKKVFLHPGEEKTITIMLGKEAVSYFSVEKKQFCVEKGSYEIQVGTSSRNIVKTNQILIEKSYMYK
ncbi:glycoside hydrolase family 3 C-terminal domain-containing protein [Anaeromicropila populeti]|uniref:Beta-glucosidase n=1 Tax=Anaeromicropila populeti TaxID=37658 RepID=A0A1I6J9J4_9FIRM|nr:glycoside hydrolase family 3 C-terminal domain-containing protein [Anaeromicropila populeti]SFR75614.1 beta-glucosidase [Anaeromicropila populeti]